MLSHNFYEYSMNLNQTDIKEQSSIEEGNFYLNRKSQIWGKETDRQNILQIVPFSSINYVIAKLRAWGLWFYNQ